MSLYAAIDLHSNNGLLAVLDEASKVVHRQRVPNRLAAVLQELAPFKGEIEGIAVESTYNWYWLVDGLADAAYKVHLVHASAVPQYDGLKHGDDESDAVHLAHLLRLGLLPEGHIYPREQRSLRDLMRRRMLLVQQATRLRQSVQSTYARVRGAGLSGKEVAALDDAAIAAAFDDTGHQVTVQALWQARTALEQQVERLERWVLGELKPSPQLVRLRTIPGVGPILGLVILLETGTIQRFAEVGDYVSYCRMVESTRWSNGKLKGRGNKKSGNRYLCWAYIEAANHAVRHDEAIRRWYERKFGRRGKRVIAIKAVAHKLARAAFHMLRDGADFDVRRAFG